MVKKYFGNEDPIGKTLKLFLYDTSGRGETYNITGVIPDAAKNAHFTFNFLVSFKSLETADPEAGTARGWGNNSYYTYLLLRDKTDRQKVEAGLESFLKRNRPETGPPSGNRFLLNLQPLTDIHLQSNLRYEIESTGSMNYVYIFISIGLFILLIAAINYMNLATARSLNRAREVGVQKVLGATKKQLVGQHITESVLVAVVAFIAAVFITIVLKPVFTGLSGKDLSLFETPWMIAFLFLTTVVIGILSGIYPAFFITAYKAGDVLKGSFKSRPAGVYLRKGLVVLQFAIAVILIAGILIINNQLSFIQQKDLGFNKEGLMAIKVNGNTDVIQNFDAFKNTLLSQSTIKGVARSNTMIIGGVGNSGARTVDGKGEPLRTGTYRIRVDADYMKVYGMQLLKGRNFYDDNAVDTAAYIVNEALVKAFGWKDNDDALNKPFEMAGHPGSVVGVVKSFHFHTLQHPIEPLVMIRMNDNFSQITVKADLADPKKTIAEVSAAWKKHFPGVLMEQSFVDERLNDQYKAEEKYAGLFMYFSALALLIACLGLLGLTAFATQQRVKEIGIRKVLGASTGNIAAMLSADFLKLVLAAAIIAFPVAWLMMNKWLQDFAFRININGWNFITAGIIVFTIAMLTISFQAIKAAIANPVKSLRTE
jgi:putative ABC transport system permease protein